MTNYITTNLRLPKEDWLEIRAIAGEMGISVNELVQRALALVSSNEKSVVKLVAAWKRGQKRAADDPFWKILDLAKMENKPLGSLSAEDEIIYG